MADNLDIFIFTQNDFDICPVNPSYKIVSIGGISTNKPLEQISCDIDKDPLLKMEHGYSEGARLHYLWKNYPLKDYIGTAHYRRYFEFFDEIPDMNEIFKEYDAILPLFNLGWKTLRGNYKMCHCEDDLNTVTDIIEKEYPSFKESCDKTLESDLLYPCNIFVLKKDMFLEYCEFVFGVLDSYNKKMGFTSDEDIQKWVDSNYEKYCVDKNGINSSPQYQSRIQAFLMERISTIFFNAKCKNPLVMPMVLTEVKLPFEFNYYNTSKKRLCK